MQIIHDTKKYKENFERAIMGRDLYLFGAGEDCENMLSECSYRERIRGILDNDEKKAGRELGGVPILPSSALADFDLENIVIVISAGAKFLLRMEQQLEKAGIQYIFHHSFLGNFGKNIYGLIGKHSYDVLQSDYFTVADADLAKIENLKHMLNDDLSRIIVDTIVKRRKERWLSYVDLFTPDQYFPKDIIALSTDEVLVDGGAYTGDTVAEFLKNTKDQFQKIYAFEPDVGAYQSLREFANGKRKVECINAGLWNQTTRLCFSGSGDGSSVISDTGLQKISVMRLDEAVQEKVTLIKMDIEGAERRALEGARQIILRDRPKLAICIYHERDDLWEIPFYIKQLVPEYQMYIRHHSDTIFETVLYAACKEAD